jgi:anti-anti-sigma factor
MQITREMAGGVLELRIQGRLDNEAADDFLAVVDDVLREGHHAVLLDLRGVDYLSSAGLGAMVRAQKRFQAIHGAFGVASVSPQAGEILRLTKLGKLLMCDADEVREKHAGSEGTALAPFRLGSAEGLCLSIYDLPSPAELRCHVWGDAARLVAGRSGGRNAPQVSFPGDTFGLGIGAFGHDEADCADRYGELIAAAGSVAVQPTPEGARPDYQLVSGQFVPQPHLLYGLSFAGAFSQMIRFESPVAASPTGLSTLVDQCLKESGADVAGIVMIAEAAGLIGARLRRSPVPSPSGGASFSHPEIRKWFSFASEHLFAHSLIVAVGVASREDLQTDKAALMPVVRRLSSDLDLYGHFHAAVFSYRPLKKRRLNLQETVLNLFEEEELQAVLHLLHDGREISGSGESQLVTGACWVGPIVQVAAEG